MKTIVIDAKKGLVREDHPEAVTLDYFYKTLDCDLVTPVIIDGKNEIWVDDEGLLTPCEHFFYYEGAHQPFAGSGVVCSTDSEGNSVDTTLTVEEVASKVKFLTRAEAYKMATEADL